MADTIESLSIQISADASSADSALKGFIQTLGGLVAVGKPAASALTKIANAFKSIASGSVSQANAEITNTTQSCKELGFVSKSLKKDAEELGDAFKFKGTQKEIDNVARSLEKAGLTFLSKDVKGIGKIAGLSDLEKIRAQMEGIADAYAEKGDNAVAEQLRNAAKAPVALNAALREADESQKAAEASAKEAEKAIKAEAKAAEKAANEAKKLAAAEEELNDAFRFTGSQGEIDSVAKRMKSAGLEDLSEHLKSVGREVALGSLDSLREELDGIADALYEAGNPEAAQKLREAAKAPEEMDANLREMKKSAKEASNAMKDVEKETEKAGSAANKSSGLFGKLIKSLGRIAFYRAIRTAIKNVSSAIKEGLTNLYAYSQEVGTAFAPAVDGLRQHVLLLKNAFATALRPVIEALIPIVIQLVDALSKAADFMAQVFSVLFGKTDEQGRYTKAVLGDLEQSNKEAKELRRTLLGFDEINRLDGDTGKSEAKTAGAQFVQADVGESAKGIAEWLKGINWELIFKVIKIALALFAAWKGLKLLSSLGGIATKLAPIVKAVAGFVAAHPILVAIVALIGVFAAYGDKIAAWFDKAKSKGDKFFDSLETKFSSLNALVQILKGTFDFVMDTIGTVASMVYKLVHGDLAGALKDLVHILGNIVVFIIDIVTGVINFILGCVDDTYVFILEVAQWIWNKALQPVFNWIMVALTNAYIWIHNAWIDLKSGVLIAVKWLLEQINKLLLIPLQNKINDAIDLWNTIFGANVAHVNLAINTDALQETINTLQETKLPSVESDVELVPKWEGEIEPLGLRIDPEPAKQWIRDIEKSLGDAIDKATGKFTGKVLEATSEAIRAVNNSTRPNKSFAQYAGGGYPSAGSLFVAGEAGPELVTQIGSTTGVWNSDQLVQGMYSAMSAALANNPQGGGDIYLDGEVIYRNTVRRNNNAVRATGRSALLT